MIGLEVIKSGIFTLVQDSGRYGYMDMGITQSGVMDQYSYDWLNKLLENDKNTNCIEIVFGNIKLLCHCDTFMAVTGAKCELFINSKVKENWKVHKVYRGDIITIGKILKGSRVYFTVKGGFDIPLELGSVSTTFKESIGGLKNGSKLKNGDILPCKEHIHAIIAKTADKYIPNYNDIIVLRVILGYQEESFSKDEKDKFFNTHYEVTSSFDRMGCKLKGEAIKSSLNGIISEAISFGSIQIPKDGQPIILLNDRQTIGGYPKIGIVLPIDCFKLSQASTGNKIIFNKLELNEAINIIKEYNIKEAF